MRNIIIILLLLPFIGQSQTKWRQIERSLTKWNIPAAYDSIPGQAGYAGKWIALTALLDSLGIDSIGGGGGGSIGTGLANRMAYWKSVDTITFDSAMYWDNVNKRLGFNTTTPAHTVDIEGRIRLNQSGNIFINGGNTTVSGNNNVGVGNNAIDEVTTGSNNFAMGISSLTEMKTGSQNVGLGNQSLRENESGTDNIGIGYESLYSYTGSETVAVGVLAGSDAEGDGNIFIGHNAGRFSNGGEKLHIDNSSTGTPLIGGEFAKNRVGINKNVQTDTLKATLHVGGTVIVDSRTGTVDKYAGFDTNGKLVEFTPSGGGAADSTIVTDGYGINVIESPANTFTVSADTAQLVTPYDLSLVDQSITNEIQVIDTFQVYDTNKLRISLSQDNQPAKVVTLPSTIDSTVVSAGFGLTGSESPANTWNIAADSTKLATQHDISGFVDGTGTATRPAIWSDANTLTSDSNLDWNNTDKRLLIGPNTAATTPNKLQVVGTGTSGQYIMQVENEANVTSAGGINIFGNNSNTSFVPLNTNASTTGSVIINNTNSNTGGGSAYINTSVNGTTGDAYIITQKASGTAWSLGMKQSTSYAGRFTISESSTLTAAGERLSIGTGGVVRVKALDTDAAAPSTSGTTRAVITDANGDLSFTTFPTAIDSTVVSAGYGLTSTESPANTFTVAADTSKLVTPYDLSLVDQSSTNEIQTIDTFQVFDTNKLRISLSQDGQAAKVVTLPTSGGGGGIDSTIITAGWGIDVTESPLNTFTVKADTAEVATQFDISGFVSGSGTATRPAFWTGTKTLSSDSNFDWDNTNKKLSLGTGFLESAFRLHVGGNPASTTGLATFEHSGTTNGAAILNLTHNQTASNQIFTIRSRGVTSGNLINEQKNDDTGIGSSLYRALVTGTGDSYFQTGKVSGNNWSFGFKQSDSYGGRFTLSYSSNLASANEMFSMSTSGVGRIKSLSTGLTAPTTSGTARMVITDANGDLSFTTIPTAGVTGSGTANYMTYWNTNTTIAGTSIAYGTSFVGLGFGVAPASVTHALHINNDALRLQGSATIIDKTNSGGANGYVLSGTGGSGVEWKSLSSLGADVSNTNEIQSLSTTGAAGNISISGGNTITLNVNDADASATNEAQTLSLSAGTISLSSVSGSGGGSVFIPSYAYGILYNTGNLSSVTLDATARKLDFTSGDDEGTTASTANDEITITTTGVYKIEYNGTYQTQSPHVSSVYLEIYNNSSDIGYIGQCRTRNDENALNNLTNFSRSFITNLSAGDDISLYYRKSTGNDTTCSFYNINLIVTRIN